MKHPSFILLVIFVWMPASICFAQNPVSVIDSLDIEIWPDYDRASVLVLLTGALPGDTRFPASVTLPFPKAAQLNAVARIDGKDGIMKDDIVSGINSAGLLTLITPDLRFRVEYYLPYVVDKIQRSFDYTWLAGVTVNNLQLRVQRPTWANTFNTEPAAVNIVRGGDGFDYHIFPTRAVLAGKPFQLHVDYKMTTAQLSVTSLPRQNTSPQTSAIASESSTGFSINWALAAIVTGSLIIIAALIWQFSSRRPSPDIRGQNDSRALRQSRAGFCRNCGEPVEEGDRFCSGCGSEL